MSGLEWKLTTEKIDKPWGFEQIKVRTERYVIKSLHINPGEGTSIQYHASKDESITLISGHADILLYESKDAEPQEIHLASGQWVRLAPGTIHRLQSNAGCQLLEVSTPELEDVVRLVDFYGR